MRAHIVWTGGLDFEARAPARGPVKEPADAPGNEAEPGARSDDGHAESELLPLVSDDADGGFGPASLLLVALAGCTGMDAISILAKKRQRVDGYEIEVTAERHDDHPRAFTRILVTHSVTGRAVDDAAVARAIELSARTYCPVGATIASGEAVIEHRATISDEAGGRSIDVVTVGPRGAGITRRAARPGR